MMTKRMFGALATAITTLSITAGCAVDAQREDDDEAATADAITAIAEANQGLKVSQIRLLDEAIVSEASFLSEADIKPGFEFRFFKGGLRLEDGEFAVVNFAPKKALAQRPSLRPEDADRRRQDAGLYVNGGVPSETLYTVPTRYSNDVPYGHGPGVSVAKEAICDFGTLTSLAESPYPGVMPLEGGSLVDGKVHAGALLSGSAGRIHVRLMAQVEHCDGPITTAAQADREPRLCYEKLRWLQANRPDTEVGNVSAYKATVFEAQVSMCED